jgi:hypothetical protein
VNLATKKWDHLWSTYGSQMPDTRSFKISASLARRLPS